MTLRVLACLGILLVPPGAEAQPRRPELPPEILERLDRERWHLARPPTTSRKSAPAGALTNVLRGDFDGDGVVDVAVLLESATGVESIHLIRRVVVFVRGAEPVAVSGDIFVDADGPFLRLAPKGAHGYDLDTNRGFTLERDAIALLYEGRGPCLTFVFRSGRFDTIWTCD